MKSRIRKILITVSVAISALAIVVPFRIPVQPVMALLWFACTVAAFLIKDAERTRPYWLLLFAPLALGKTAVAVAIYFSCALNYPAGCP